MDLDGCGRRHHAVTKVGHVDSGRRQAVGDGTTAEGIALLHVGSKCGGHKSQQEGSDESAQEAEMRECV